MKILIVGGPGAGKGSLATLLAKDYNIPHISSGEIFRENIKNKTALGKIAEEYVNSGRLVPDELVVDMMINRLKQADAGPGFVLDGFPRTIEQTKILDKHFKMDVVIQILATAKTVIKRLGGRWTCKECAAIHNTRWDDISKCRDCGAQLFQRDDDHEEGILKRLEIYRVQVAPILQYYKDKVIDINSEINDNYQDVYARLRQRYANIFK